MFFVRYGGLSIPFGPGLLDVLVSCDATWQHTCQAQRSAILLATELSLPGDGWRTSGQVANPGEVAGERLVINGSVEQ